MSAKQKSARSAGGKVAPSVPNQHDGKEQKASRRPSRAPTRLAAEIERLAAELAASRTRINELESRIDVDPLTETLNRRGFERELRRALAYVKRYGASAALIYLDLDAFKPVNDGFGHAAGDAVLKAIAAALIRNVRTSDVVARIGGDEFVALIWNVSEAEAMAKAVALEAAVGATLVRFGGMRLSVGASAGATAVAPLDTPAHALARADAAMYALKMANKTPLHARSEKRSQAMMSGVN